MPKGAMLGCDPSHKALSYREREVFGNCWLLMMSWGKGLKSPEEGLHSCHCTPKGTGNTRL